MSSKYYKPQKSGTRDASGQGKINEGQACCCWRCARDKKQGRDISTYGGGLKKGGTREVLIGLLKVSPFVDEYVVK